MSSYSFFKKKKYLNSLIVKGFKHKHITDLILPFKNDIDKLIHFLNKLMYCKHFNMKLLLVRNLLFYDKLMFNNIEFNINKYLSSYHCLSIQILFFYNIFDISNKSKYPYNVFFFRIFDLYNYINSNFLDNFFISFYIYLFFYFFFISTRIYLVSKQYNFASLPNKIVKYTVLRSPHTNKKSREQFELKTYKKILSYPSIFYNYYNYLFINKHNSCFCNITHILKSHMYDKL